MPVILGPLDKLGDCSGLDCGLRGPRTPQACSHAFTTPASMTSKHSDQQGIHSASREQLIVGIQFVKHFIMVFVYDPIPRHRYFSHASTEPIPRSAQVQHSSTCTALSSFLDASIRPMTTILMTPSALSLVRRSAS